MAAREGYKSWKGNVWEVVNGEGQYFRMIPSVVPAFSRPNFNSSSNSVDPNLYAAPFAKPRPLKLYRKQLVPVERSGKSNASMGNAMDIPGGAVYLATSDGSGCPSCQDVSNGLTTILTYHGDRGECNTCYKESCGDPSGNSFGCIRRMRDGMGARTASTIVSKKYYASNASYLRARSRTFGQNQTMNAIAGHVYFDASGNPINPSNSSTGSQVYNTGTCENKDRACNQTIYKPNNRQFSTQGAVSSSSRIDLLKLNVRDKEAKLWKESDLYQQGIALGSKKFVAPCVDNLVNRPQFDGMRIKSGNPSTCFLTQIAALQRQSKTVDQVYGISKANAAAVMVPVA
jgi:hypothetical protein